MRYTDIYGNKVSLLGLGCMRFPEDGNGNADEERSVRMIRDAIDNGITYLDTAFMYHDGNSEKILGKALKDGYRERVLLADKMPPWLASSPEDLESIFAKQLERLNTDHIDFYLIHSVDEENFRLTKELDVLPFLDRKKAEGRIRYIGFSFHDSYELFDEILSFYPWDICQIQYNYVDEEHQAGRKGLELARKKNIPVVIMEPLKGGRLARRFPPVTDPYWERMSERKDPVDWAFSWLADQPGIMTILSGMSSEEQLEHNIRLFDTIGPGCMKDADRRVLADIADAFRDAVEYGCTGCGYCMPCPAGLEIPNIIGFYNDTKIYDRAPAIYDSYSWMDHPASACVACGKCESVCPQGLPIREIMKKAAKELENA